MCLGKKEWEDSPSKEKHSGAIYRRHAEANYKINPVVIHFGAPYKKMRKRENTKKLKKYCKKLKKISVRKIYQNA
jgi:hypothetical protein